MLRLFVRSRIHERKDVPTNVQQILIEVVNKKCKDITKNGGNFTPLSDDKYDCELGQKAFGRGPSDGTDLGLLTFFDGKSTNSVTGIHELDLRCNYGLHSSA
nr:unnamed protein product [Haemonchus contortus]